MIKYILDGNKVKAEFDWAYKYTCPQAQWKTDIGLYIQKKTGCKDLYPVVAHVLRKKTSFCGTAYFDEVTSIEQAKEYAKKNLLDKYYKTTIECLDLALNECAGATYNLSEAIKEVKKRVSK